MNDYDGKLSMAFSPASFPLEGQTSETACMQLVDQMSVSIENAQHPAIINARPLVTKRCSSLAESRLYKRAKVEHNFSLPQELWEHILSCSLKEPEGKYLVFISLVCKKWHNSLDNIRVSLINRGIRLRDIFSSLATSEVLPKSVSIFFENYGGRLACLNLSRCWKITDAALNMLTSLTQLQNLRVSACCAITHRGIKTLSSLPKLQILNLNFCTQVMSPELSSLTALTNLHTLELAWCDRITDVELKTLTTLTWLQSLNLAHCDLITDKGLGFLTTLMQLQNLNLSNCSLITDTGLSVLAGLIQLKSLNLSNCKLITDKGCKAIAKLRQLQSLNLYGCNQVTLAGLTLLSTNLNQLQRLYLKDTETKVTAWLNAELFITS